MFTFPSHTYRYEDFYYTSNVYYRVVSDRMKSQAEILGIKTYQDTVYIGLDGTQNEYMTFSLGIVSGIYKSNYLSVNTPTDNMNFGLSITTGVYKTNYIFANTPTDAMGFSLTVSTGVFKDTLISQQQPTENINFALSLVSGVLA